MNPSAQGWIKKLLKDVSNDNSLFKYSEEAFYSALRKCGFIYGSNLNVVEQIVESESLSEDEICKLNLCLALLYTHNKSKSNSTFINSIYNFYTEISELKTSFFSELLKDKDTSNQVEKIIHKRIHIDDNVFTKNFKYFVINALIYIDVIAYQEYLKTDSISVDFIKNLESSLEYISLNVLNSKKIKNEYDTSLIELFEVSLRFQNDTDIKTIGFGWW